MPWPCCSAQDGQNGGSQQHPVPGEPAGCLPYPLDAPQPLTARPLGHCHPDAITAFCSCICNFLHVACAESAFWDCRNDPTHALFSICSTATLTVPTIRQLKEEMPRTRDAPGQLLCWQKSGQRRCVRAGPPHTFACMATGPSARRGSLCQGGIRGSQSTPPQSPWRLQPVCAGSRLGQPTALPQQGHLLNMPALHVLPPIEQTLPTSRYQGFHLQPTVL